MNPTAISELKRSTLPPGPAWREPKYRSSTSKAASPRPAPPTFGGSVYFDKLKPGAYQVREVSAPSGFVKDDQTYTVNVTSGTETSFVLKNQAKPGLIITKYDEQTHEVLPM